MTATQLFIQFLRETCDIGEYFFFREIISHDPGNRYFKKRPLFKKDFVEGYLSRNGRQLRTFMTRMFILAPNLIKKRNSNPRWKTLYNRYKDDEDQYWREWWISIMNSKGTGVYVRYYCDLWHYWLDRRVDWGNSNKRPCSNFKKGENCQFTLRKNGKDNNLQHETRRPHRRT